MFDRYTEGARRVIFFGRAEASQYGNGQIESEHLLVALLNEDRALAAFFFRSADAAGMVRPKIAQRFPSGLTISTAADMPLSQAAKQVLHYAAEESDRLKDQHIAPAHLLLGLLRDKESVAAEILTEHGVSADEVRQYLVNQPALAGAVQPAAADLGMLKMITGFWASRAIYTSAKLGIPDLLKDGPKAARELATATGSDPKALYRMLRALASVGVFEEHPGERFGTNALAQSLEERPGSLRNFALAELGQEHYGAWAEFPGRVRTGAVTPHANFIVSTPIDWVMQTILEAYDFSRFHKIVDIGGGQGAFLAGMLGRAAKAHGVLFDSAEILAAGATPDDRVEAVAGNLFEAVPAGGDLYTLKMVLQDRNDAECHSILANIRKAIVAGGTVVIVETMLGPGPDSALKNFLDLNMMVMTGGRERAEAAFQVLLENAGFRLTRVVPTGSLVSIVEAVAV